MNRATNSSSISLTPMVSVHAWLSMRASGDWAAEDLSGLLQMDSGSMARQLLGLGRRKPKSINQLQCGNLHAMAEDLTSGILPSPHKPYNRLVSGYYCYILECADGTFYTGWTTDHDRRLDQHNRGQGSRYTRARRPVQLVYLEDQPDRSSAQKRERCLKALPRSQKEEANR